MNVYEVEIKSRIDFTRDTWLICARTLAEAVGKADKKRKRDKDLWAGAELTNAKLIGEIDE